jgi:cysteine desulfurase
VPGIVRTGEGQRVLPNTLHVRFPGVAGRDVLAHASDVAASTGSACHSDHDAVSGVLGAMGLGAAEAMGAVRLSLGRSTTAADVERAAASIAAAFSLTRR